MIPTALDDDGIDAAWRLTRAVSPRPRVRVAAQDAAGEPLNSYTSTASTSSIIPSTPWAVYLADDQQQFRLLALDLDVHTGDAAQAAEDADQIAALASSVGLDPLVCVSGPAGGRHVWIGLGEPVPAELVATIAHLAKAVYPSLDTAPLLNPRTGCVRPPGAPHRAGGASRPVAGSLDTLLQPAGTIEHLTRLAEALAEKVTTGTGPSSAAGTSQLADDSVGLVLDEAGHPWLPGPRRPLPPASAAAITEDAAAGDASAVMWRVLIGAAAAHWHLSELAELARHSPGLEHVRTFRDGTRRRLRPTTGDRSPKLILRRQWEKAIVWVKQHPRMVGADPTFDERAGRIAVHIRAVQARAAASPGRWSRGGGPADRRVLDVLCLWAVQAVQPVIEADIRRLAMTAGIGRETARIALQRLASDGWITQARPAIGRRASAWQIGPQADIHSDAKHSRSQAIPRPRGAGTAARQVLLDHLAPAAAARTHDVFTAHFPALGLAAGNAYAALTTCTTPTRVLTERSGLDAVTLQRALLTLERAGLAVYRRGWIRPRTDRRDRTARTTGCTGRLKTRADQYDREREQWAWWCAEHEWMTTPCRNKRHRQPFAQPALVDSWDNDYPPYPRRADHRADHRAARAALVAGILPHWCEAYVKTA